MQILIYLNNIPKPSILYIQKYTSVQLRQFLSELLITSKTVWACVYFFGVWKMSEVQSFPRTPENADVFQRGDFFHTLPTMKNATFFG